MGQENCSYSHPQPVVNDTPPTVPTDLVTAYNTLLKSGEHKRNDLLCLEQMQKGSTRLKERMDHEATDCSRQRVGPALNEIYGKNIEREYMNWLETLRVKHKRESRDMHNKHTQGINVVREKFADNEKEPMCQDLQESLYTCFRKNPSQSLKCHDDAICYIGLINKNASVCFRMGPASKRKQKSCKVNLNPARARPYYDHEENKELPPYPPELMVIEEPEVVETAAPNTS